MGGATFERWGRLYVRNIDISQGTRRPDSAAAAGTIALTASAPRPRPGRRRQPYWIAGVFVLIAAGAAAGPLMSRVEQPEYKIDSSDGSIEVRSYGPMIAAEAVVEGERKAAIGEGFRIIAAYIFGANTPNARIPMTAPVQQQKQTILTTAPVAQRATGNAWTVRFIMPKSSTMETLPVPSDRRVTLRPIPAHRFVVIRFSGIATDGAIAKRTDELWRYAADHRLSTTGEPLLAFYNPPWTLPFLRRNEVLFELAS
jgi:SOUL heme-binding protein